MKIITATLLLAGVLAWGGLFPAVGHADLMPSFADASTWVVDRYAPHSFGDVGTFQNRNNVLGIEINPAESSENRKATNQESSFYNTQGRDHPLSGGGIGSVLSAALYIPASWSNAANGSVRTDMWGVMTDGTDIGSDYTIIGFTNNGSAGATFQIFDGDHGGWNAISPTVMPVTYNAWNTLAIKFTGTSYLYYINGSLVYTDATINKSTGFSWVDMQAYNFDAPVGYTAYWANTPAHAPIPASVLLLGSGLFGLALLGRRKLSCK
jgi:hypothetical protein